MTDMNAALRDPRRLDTLARTALLDSPREEEFDRLARLAARFLGVPVALVSLVDDERQTFKGSVGMEKDAMPLSHSYCKHVVHAAAPFVIEDAREHPLLRDNPAIADCDAIAYCGVPLTLATGEILGSLCAMDHQPRTWSADDVAVLEDLAVATVAQIELRLANRALDTRERLLSAVIETEPQCVKLIARDGSLLQMNRAGLEMIEADSFESVRGAAVCDLVRPEHRSAFNDLVRGVFSGQSGTLQFEIEGLGGTRRWLETHAVPFRDEHGGVVAQLAITRDITAERESAAALARSEEQLRQAQKLEAVGRLAGGVAHDFNNLLTGIIGYADLVAANAAPELAADAAAIRGAAERAADLTRQLLAFSRQQVLQPRSVDLNESLRRSTSLLRRLIGTDVTLELELEPALPPVLADPGQLDQIVMNLGVNARDAMPNGGTLRVRTWQEPRARGTDVFLEVTDTGVGIPTDDVAHIFEPFFTTKGVGEGTGLGLATVHGIVSQSGGTIAVSSEPGRTSFRIALPAAADAPAPPAREAVPVGGLTGVVLLAEDEEVVRSLAERILTAAGYDVLVAADGVEAIELAALHLDSLDVLVTDMQMPGTSGAEVIRTLRASRPGIGVVTVSGYSEELLADGGTSPVDGLFVQKPFTPSGLLEAVAAAAGRAG